MPESLDEIEASLRWALSKPVDYLFLLGRGSDLLGSRKDESKNGKLIRYHCYWNEYKGKLTKEQRDCVIWCIVKRDLIPFWNLEIAKRHTGVEDPVSVADGAIRDLAVIIKRVLDGPARPQNRQGA